MRPTLLSLVAFQMLAGSSPALHASVSLNLQAVTASQQSAVEPVLRFAFDGTTSSAEATDSLLGGPARFVRGLDGQALSVSSDALAFFTLHGEDLAFDPRNDFSVQLWLRTVMDSGRRFVVLSHKEFASNSLAAQKQPGWVFYVSGGTWAWSMGSGTRRITYERDNGKHMPLNDGRWHQLTMTYSSARSEVRLFYDGENKVSYKVNDAVGFDFTTTSPLTVGWDRPGIDHPSILPAIETGAIQLQRLVDAFNGLGLRELAPEEFASLIVDPRGLFERRANEVAELLGTDRSTFVESMASVDFEPIAAAEAELMRNPYTVHQAMSFMEAAPLLKIFSLVDGEVVVRQDAARAFTETERLDPPDFDMDNLAIWDRVLTPEEVSGSYSDYFTPVVPAVAEELGSITVGAWNIFHGGKHFTTGEDGWDSRIAIARILERENVDVVMMQETYSSGDFIAAELGYYFATTVDWDYLNQGANISVLSRYPITELHVQDDSPFMNVGVKISVSETQDLYAMSNWYGMQQFPAVVAFHESRFQESDIIPTVFAGDFNAVPHTDGGDSPASRALLDAGFTDAFRSLHPNPQEHPGHTHRSGRRIDQLYYRGMGLTNTSTRLITTWPPGFPSDHYLIRSTFDLDYTTPETNRHP